MVGTSDEFFRMSNKTSVSKKDGVSVENVSKSRLLKRTSSCFMHLV